MPIEEKVPGKYYFFERIVWKCVEGVLIDSHKIFVDANRINARWGVINLQLIQIRSRNEY